MHGALLVMKGAHRKGINIRTNEEGKKGFDNNLGRKKLCED